MSFYRYGFKLNCSWFLKDMKSGVGRVGLLCHILWYVLMIGKKDKLWFSLCCWHCEPRIQAYYSGNKCLISCFYQLPRLLLVIWVSTGLSPLKTMPSLYPADLSLCVDRWEGATRQPFSLPPSVEPCLGWPCVPALYLSLSPKMLTVTCTAVLLHMDKPELNNCFLVSSPAF